MSEYWPFIVLIAFAVVVYFGTIIWTEYLFPEKEKESSEDLDEIDQRVVIKAAQLVAASLQIEKAHEKEEKRLQLAGSAR